MSSVWIDLNELWIKIDSNSVAAISEGIINSGWMNELWMRNE